MCEIHIIFLSEAFFASLMRASLADSGCRLLLLPGAFSLNSSHSAAGRRRHLGAMAHTSSTTAVTVWEAGLRVRVIGRWLRGRGGHIAIRSERGHQRRWPHVAHALCRLATMWPVTSAPLRGAWVPQTNDAESKLASFKPYNASYIQRCIGIAELLVWDILEPEEKVHVNSAL